MVPAHAMPPPHSSGETAYTQEDKKRCRPPIHHPGGAAEQPSSPEMGKKVHQWRGHGAGPPAPPPAKILTAQYGPTTRGESGNEEPRDAIKRSRYSQGTEPRRWGGSKPLEHLRIT
ncbi:hypothetical protein NDU88_011314 [Pleurodeles waltl]|uniref:Uncharacterized protein n=1 Tax=Pleurodeles waltl TaxID=8319 RepID=A0AAV7R015_PLEWA|nr:hypothetical protein NDU88_011314 [Pleurodeles waltl]